METDMLLEQILCYRSYLVLSFRLNNHVHYTRLSTTVVLYGKVWQNVSHSLHFDIKLHVPSRIFGRQPKPLLLYNAVNFVLSKFSTHFFFKFYFAEKDWNFFICHSIFNRIKQNGSPWCHSFSSENGSNIYIWRGTLLTCPFSVGNRQDSIAVCDIIPAVDWCCTHHTLTSIRQSCCILLSIVYRNLINKKKHIRKIKATAHILLV